ncbi:MAG: ribonuclease P protein component [Anaerolineae bacterium]|nr:ribonuclease P protein component [Anaerolineae bacterium]
MKRKFRLTKATDFKRVRRSGKSYAHPLVVLVISPNELQISRFGISASKAVGNAVQRNRVKRQLREIIRSELVHITSGWDMVVIARSKITQAHFAEIHQALEHLLSKAGLIYIENTNVN